MPFLYRFRFKVQGGHTHVRVFAGKEPGSPGKCGDLVFRNEEWNEFRKVVEYAITRKPEGVGTCIEFLPEQPDINLGGSTRGYDDE